MNRLRNNRSSGKHRPSAAAILRRAGEPSTVFRVKVDMVVLSFTVTDSKGHYINGLKPTDFRILEDGIRRRSPPSPKATSRRSR